MNEKHARKLRKQIEKRTGTSIDKHYGTMVYVPRKGLQKYEHRQGDPLWARGLMIVNTGLRSLYQREKRHEHY